jgi:STE24 endopeptidase
MTASTFTTIFIAALALSLATHLWLAWRQLRYVAAHRGQVPPEFAQTISIAAHQKAADYTCAKTRLSVVEALLGTAVLLPLFTLGGGIAWLMHASEPLASWPITRDIAIMVGFALISGLASLPFSLYGVFVIEERFGFNKMTFALWLADLFKGLALGAAIGIPLLALILWLMHAAGNAWWIWAWAAWTGFQSLMLVLYPTLIAPLFNKFSPLTEERVKARVEALLARCGFRSKGLFVMDGSKRSSHGNAYFTGFGAAKRIVFFDTLLQRLEPIEVEAVLAHELGHFKLRHVLKRLSWVFAISLGALALLAWVRLQPWFYAGLGVPEGVAAQFGVALLLFFLVLPLLTFVLAPLASALSRKHEFEADRYATEHASAPDLARALVKLYEDNASTLTPDPLHSVFYDSHPPAAQRIARLVAPPPLQGAAA